MTISMDKKYRTRDGRDVRLLCVDGPDAAPVVGMFGGRLSMWQSDGSAFKGEAHFSDLIEYHEPDIRTIWVNVYECGNVEPFNVESGARKFASDGAISIAQPVTFEVKRNT